MTNYVQPTLPGFEEFVAPPFPDLQEMLEYLNTTSIDTLKHATQVWSLIKVFGITSSEACQVLEYWKALPKKEKKDD